MRLGRWLLVGFRFGRRGAGWRKSDLGVILFRQLRDFYFLRLRGRRDVRLELFGGLLRLGRRRIGLWRFRRCDWRWRRQIRRLVHRRRRYRASGRAGPLSSAALARPLAAALAEQPRGRKIDHDCGRRSVRRRFGLAPVEGRPGRGEMDRSHNDRRRAPAKRGKRRLPSHGPAISALCHGRGAPFIGPGAGAPTALGPVPPFDWPVSSSPTNAIFR